MWLSIREDHNADLEDQPLETNLVIRSVGTTAIQKSVNGLTISFIYTQSPALYFLLNESLYFLQTKGWRFNIYKRQNKIKIKKKVLIVTFCSGRLESESIQFLLHESRVSCKLLFLSGIFKLLDSRLLKEFLLLLLKVLKILFCRSWWARIECLLKSDKTSSLVVLMWDPNTHVSHCFNHRSTWTTTTDKKL